MRSSPIEPTDRLPSAPSVTVAARPAGSRNRTFRVLHYNLKATLTSGQAFRWRRVDAGWEGVVGSRWVRLAGSADGIDATTAVDCEDWTWLEHYLQLQVSIDEVTGGFPRDRYVQSAVRECRGLRLLRQDVWECLASFILSSTKQIVQIEQVVERLCHQFGEPVAVGDGATPRHTFPPPHRIAGLSERQLRLCGMGFRAPYLRDAARMIVGGEIELDRLGLLDLKSARMELMRLPGVGRKIADCVLLFATGHAAAFPVDVWIMKTLRQWYFSGREVPMKELLQFAENYFGKAGGYAQQYLFQFARQQAGRIR
jgi:N-glycosylase/DNA lyase